MIQLTFLGTASTLPTKTRSHTSTHLQFLGHSMLFDCGENTQQQLLRAGQSVFRINYIFITHLHADHMLGLFGILQSAAFMGKTSPLTIVGPKGIRKYINFALNWDFFESSYPVNIIEITKDKRVVDDPDFTINAYSVKHQDVPCYAYVFEEKVQRNLDKHKLKKLGLFDNPICSELKNKGKIKWKNKTVTLEQVSNPLRQPKKIVYCMDTNPIDKIKEFSMDADVLVCESTFAERDKIKAHEYGHMTTQDAASLAKFAKVNRLVLTHFSQRYKDTKELEQEARAVFRNTLVADELMQIEI